MFEVTIGSLVLIAFVWGPIVYAREHNGTVQYDPLQTLAHGLIVYKGVMEKPS